MPPRVRYKRGGGARNRHAVSNLAACFACKVRSESEHPDFKFYDSLFYPMHENQGPQRVAENIHE